MSAKNKVMFTVHRVFGLQNVRPVRSKSTKADLVKRLMEENKALFGDLMETKKQKVAREKREKKLRVSKKPAITDSAEDKKPEIDTEIHYITNSKASQKLLNISYHPNFEPHQTKTLIKIHKANGEKKLSEEIAVAKDISSNKESESVKNRVTTTGNAPKKLTLPSDILINKITSFPYFNLNKNYVPEDNGKREPLSISSQSDKSLFTIPSVTKILNKTMSDESRLNLELWKQRMIQKLGEEGFEKYSKALLLNGAQFHSCIQNALIQKSYEVPSSVEKSWQSVQHVLKEVQEVRAIESHVVHSQLYYRGIIDCVAMYRGKLCVIDWKKSDKPKDSIENTFDAPIQVASYVGALNSDINYNFPVRSGLVVVGYTNGDPASVHEINSALMTKYWTLWLRRLQQFYLDIKSVDRNPAPVAAN